MRIYTIGHSTHPIDVFIAILQEHSVEQLVDVRTIPKSRRNPQFAGPALSDSLSEAGIPYVRIEQLGGLRRTSEASLNKAWRNMSFRGYADYMQTDEFAEGLDELIRLGGRKPTAIMCAEAVPWRCHRSLVGDALLIRGFEVRNIMNEKMAEPHRLTSFAVVNGKEITYPKQSNDKT